MVYAAAGTTVNEGGKSCEKTRVDITRRFPLRDLVG